MPDKTASMNQNNKGYPSVSNCTALIILIINIFLPGVGTMIMGCYSESCGKWACIGIVQILLAALIVGWIWAIYTGIQCQKFSK
jgi:hypothetical protein